MTNNFKIKRILVTVFAALLSVFVFNAQGDCYLSPANRFTHDSRNFSVIPPEGYDKVIPREDGAQFVNPQDGSFLDISFSFASEKFSDSQLMGRFKEGGFRDEFIKGLEVNTASMNAKVVSSREISVNGIPAWEFVAEGITARGAFENRFIIFYKNKKEFLLLLGAHKNTLDSKRLKLIDESLSTIDIK